MTGLRAQASVGSVLVLSAGLLAVGLSIDLLWTQPRAQDLETLERRRSEALTALSAVEHRTEEADQLAAYLGVDDLGDGLVSAHANDPLTYLTDSIKEAGLRRHELSTETAVKTSNVIRHRFFVHVQGSYPQIVKFTRTLEQAPRLAALDALVLAPVLGSNQVEARLNISIFDPIKD